MGEGAEMTDKRIPVQMWATVHVFGGIMCYPTQQEAEDACYRQSVSYDYIGPVTIQFGHESEEIRDAW